MEFRVLGLDCLREQLFNLLPPLKENPTFWLNDGDFVWASVNGGQLRQSIEAAAKRAKRDGEDPRPLTQLLHKPQNLENAIDEAIQLLDVLRANERSEICRPSNNTAEMAPQDRHQPDGQSQQNFESSGKYFAFLKHNERMTDAQIRDKWQAMSEKDRQRICPSDYDQLQTGVTTKRNEDSKDALADIVKGRRQSAETKLTKASQ